MSRAGPVLEWLQEAFEIYVKTGDHPRAVQVARTPYVVGLGRTGTSRVRQRNQQLASIRQRALKLVTPGSCEHGHLLCDYALAAYHANPRGNQAEQSLNQAATVCASCTERGLELRISATRAHVFSQQFRNSESLAASRVALELLPGTEAPFARYEALYYAAASGFFTMDAGVLGEYSALALAAARALRETRTIGEALVLSRLWHLSTGDRQQARREAEEAAVVSPELDQAYHASTVHLLLSVLEAGYWGDPEVKPMADQLAVSIDAAEPATYL